MRHSVFLYFLCLLFSDKLDGFLQSVHRVSYQSLASLAASHNSATELDAEAKIRIGGSRWIVPGDYVVNKEYGIGRYIGVRKVDITPARVSSLLDSMVIVQFKDAEISWFQRVVEKELFVFRTAESGSQELSAIIDLKKWRKRLKTAEDDSKSTALNLLRLMVARNGMYRSPCLPDDVTYEEFEKRFAFEPTKDQLASFKAIQHDMIYRNQPMDRLICGDVGFGKTEVAMRAIYRAVRSNKQVALLAPTRILAQQHLRVLRKRMPDVNIQLLTASASGKNKRLVKDDIKSGICQVVVGTHALLQPSVKFDNLGLLVIDEEQRFGVAAKEKLKAASSGADVLTLSATPIPRTLQMSLSGMRDFSSMTSAPVGRKEVIVEVVSGINDEVLKSAITNELKRDGQVFVVVPFVQDVTPTREKIYELFRDPDSAESRLQDVVSAVGYNGNEFDKLESEEIDNDDNSGAVRERTRKKKLSSRYAANINDEVGTDRWGFSSTLPELLSATKDNGGKESIPAVKIIEAHGRHDDLTERIDAFTNRQGNVLIATTVIENGIDMPNVNTIIVLSAERFGMSALYQLRGRVGRSFNQAYAYFMTNSKSSITINAESRLTYLKTFTALGSGYDLSRRDMEMRGHGTIFGGSQSGASDIGIDLQAAILSQTMEKIKENVILCDIDTKVVLPKTMGSSKSKIPNSDSVLITNEATTSSLQMLGETEWCGEMPSAEDLSSISRWEDKLIHTAITNIYSTTEATITTDTGSREENDATLRKQKKADTLSLSAKQSKEIAMLARQFLTHSSSIKELIKLYDKKPWSDILLDNGKTIEKSSILKQLIQRTKLRISARRVGVKELTFETSSSEKEDLVIKSIVLRSSKIDQNKWKMVHSLLSESQQGFFDWEEESPTSPLNIHNNHAVPQRTIGDGEESVSSTAVQNRMEIPTTSNSESLSVPIENNYRITFRINDYFKHNSRNSEVNMGKDRNKAVSINDDNVMSTIDNSMSSITLDWAIDNIVPILTLIGDKLDEMLSSAIEVDKNKK